MVATRVIDGMIQENEVVLVDNCATLLVRLSMKKNADQRSVSRPVRAVTIALAEDRRDERRTRLATRILEAPCLTR